MRQSMEGRLGKSCAKQIAGEETACLQRALGASVSVMAADLLRDRSLSNTSPQVERSLGALRTGPMCKLLTTESRKALFRGCSSDGI